MYPQEGSVQTFNSFFINGLAYLPSFFLAYVLECSKLFVCEDDIVQGVMHDALQMVNVICRHDIR